MRVFRNYRSGVVVMGAVAMAGCYTLQPVATAPAPGNAVAYDISDAGRVALGGSMGPSLKRLEGRLIQAQADEVVVAVTSVEYLNGGSQTWSGEPVHLKQSYIANTFERRFSKSRTIALSAVAIGAVAAIVTQTLVGSGSGDPREQDPPGKDPGASTTRGRRP